MLNHARLAAILLSTAIVIVPGSAFAQAQPAQPQVLPPAAVPRDEAAALAQGWVLLAEGKYDEAGRSAGSVSTRFPRSAAALALTIEVDIARGGATTALDSYEAWLGSRSLEEPAVLRRVARAYLYEWSRQTRDGVARDEALLALAEEGDVQARELLSAGAGGPSASAKAGDARAVEVLIARS